MSQKDGSKDVEQSATLEAVLSHEVGQLGKYQLSVLGLLLFNSVISALSGNEFIFTTGRINTRCLIPECEGISGNQDFSPPWILNAVPSVGDSFDNCQRFANTTDTQSVNDTCPASLFDQNTSVDCEYYVYEHTNTAVYDLELACDEWRRSLIGSVRTAGAMVALLVAGVISDRWGRRTALAIISFNTAWIGLTRYFATNYIGFVISVFAEAALGAGGITACGYILIMEVTPTKYRVTLGALSNSCFALGQVILGLVAWGIPYWRHFTLAIYAPQLVTFSYFWLMPVSIRWLLSKGQYDKAESTIKKIAKINGKEVSEKSLLDLRQAAETEAQKAKMNDGESEPWLVVLVIRNRPILVRCLVSPLWWISMILIYYGLSINAVNISGNPYLNYVAVAAVEIPGFWTAIVLIERIGRKPVLMAAFWICAAGQIAYIFIPNSQYAASLTVYLISKCAIAMVVTTVYLYTSELYPTQYRQSLFSFSSMIGRIGSIVAPLTPALGAVVWEQLPFAIFAGMAFMSGLLVLVTPETRGCRLPDTMEEAANIGVHKQTITHSGTTTSQRVDSNPSVRKRHSNGIFESTSRL